MKLELNGTAAAEAIPAPFCRCRVCSEARIRRGKDLRGRASALLDGVVQIDFGPDVISHARQFGRDLSQITTLLFTHHHADHLIPQELDYRAPAFVTDTDLALLQIYGNETVVEMLQAAGAGSATAPERYRIQIEKPLRPFEEITTNDGTTVLPLPADHAPKALVHRITRNGKVLFYGHDSGIYPEATFNALRGTPLDIALFDTTGGLAETSNRGHMGVSGVLESIERLRSLGAVTENTQLVVTHFSHNGRALHSELCAYCEPKGIAVAFDGMVIEA